MTKRDDRNLIQGHKLACLALGQLLVAAAGAETTTYEYDALGRLDVVTKENGTVTDYNYDPAGNRERKTVSDASTPQNNPPVAIHDSPDSIQQYQAIELDVAANDYDPDGDPLRVIEFTQPLNAIVERLLPSDPDDTRLRIIGWTVGDDQFTYTIDDQNGGTAIGTVSVYVHSL